MQECTLALQSDHNFGDRMASLAGAPARLLFTILIGVFSGVGSVVTDIADPFRGAYRITPTVAQFFPLREALICDVACKRTALDDPEWPPGSEHI